MKKLLYFPVVNRGLMICGANFHHPECVQGRNNTEKVTLSWIAQASHVFIALKKEIL